MVDEAEDFDEQVPRGRAKFSWCMPREHKCWECPKSFESNGRTVRCGGQCHVDGTEEEHRQAYLQRVAEREAALAALAEEGDDDEN